MRITNPMAFIQEMLQGRVNPQQMLEMLRMQNPQQYTSVIRQVESFKQRGFSPQRALIEVLGQNNPILSMLSNFGIKL